MSTQAQYNANYAAYILYYISQTGYTTRYDSFLANVCSPVYDGSGNIQITVWQLGTTPSVPSNATLLAYVNATVLAFYSSAYTSGDSIKNLSYYKGLQFTTAQINTIAVDATYSGYQVYDTSVQNTRTYNGTSWAVNSYLPLAGGTMSGNINLGGFAIGFNATAVGNGVCFGNAATSGGGASVAVGNSANASGLGAMAIGYSSVCSANNSLAIGINANNSAVGGIAFGRGAINSGVDAISIGTGANCSIGSGICIGYNSAASAVNAIALGNVANNSVANSLLVNSSANIRSVYTTCDLGTVALPFQSLYLNSSVAGPTNSRTADNIVSNTGASVVGNLALFSSITGKVVQDAALVAANVVTNTGTATSGRVAIFSSDKVVQDGGTLLTDLATNASVLATYLAKSGGTMTGSINFGQINATGFNYIQSGVAAGNIIWGSGTTITTPPGGNNIRNVYLGYNNDGTGFSLNLIGSECHQTVGASACNLIGSALNVAGANSSAYGDNITVTGTGSVAIGTNNNISVSNGYVFGYGAINSIANSMILGGANIANIRANGTICDLGTAAVPFHNLILNTGIESTAGLVIGPASATSIAIGRATVTTTINGIFVTPLPFASWYSSTTYNPSFAAGVNRLTPPTAATAGTLVDFTHALGVLTYTGAPTRQFRIAYNITFTTGATGSNMTFFNSIAASTTIGTQAQIKEQVFVQNAMVQMSLNLSDTITLTNGQTVQLAGACATLSAAVGYNFISCSISAMPN